MKTYLRLALLSVLTLGFISCGDDDSSDNGTARMAVRLTDAPGDYDAVNIDVENVVIKYNGDVEDEDDVMIGSDVNAGIYDLLELTGGANVLLVDDQVDAGRLSQIRLILAENNTIVVDGETFPLATPSAQQSGLKVQVNETLEDGVFYEFLLDFDVDESVVQEVNGGYSLKPVIRASVEARSGAISGTVLPLGFLTEVTASNGTTEITAFTNDAGEFVLAGVPEGTYTLTYEMDAAAGFEVGTVSDVNVETGVVTTVDAFTFQ
ncbi:DUF4382 domain-containing protein [Dokdonia sp. Hel_I_53]|uniref:DUF4382 domain-containing protein n=1 Tax=Dokdonia sp. Hel_I_53 TaxID=1566287 RepID=UPI00119AC4F7|nr:DUF4382 domain-containing protein [Dokdonia sp. Hel_I_53]TVZ52812.1 uncharacterized protein DUF4382 [Dokdonia sp. Hel_I_53]